MKSQNGGVEKLEDASVLSMRAYVHRLRRVVLVVGAVFANLSLRNVVDRLNERLLHHLTFAQLTET
jgi:hypothetical protein